ncbi:hypothetical protein SAMN04487970_10023 [Paenibacillus tianmuensis]|uniref:Phage tail lysozyme domain-containing protein n=1 Tax=Paenibacillus tianmuensis TaxID=624147 RepID=A0A1G4PCR9_9BACL|nr:phage tail tip lysozyme [Paenibacillus tianmuensis]SCW29918.1 hypothetical protein SAMN04487970_10023 [Paenibacillus tianmuensis]
MQWKEPTFGDTSVIKVLAAANARRKADEYDYEEEQKEQNLTYPDWAKEWVKKYKEAWYIAEASGDIIAMQKAKKLADALRDKLRQMTTLPEWAQQQMQKQTLRWMEANEVGNVRVMRFASETEQGIIDKLKMIENMKEKWPDDAKALNDLTAKWYYVDDNEFIPYEDREKYASPESAKAEYTKQAQEIIAKLEKPKQEKPKQEEKKEANKEANKEPNKVANEPAQGTGNSDGKVYAVAATTSGEHRGGLTQEQMEANARYIYKYFSGWSKEAISALLGNMQWESGSINPGAWQYWNQTGKGCGYGLVQWTPAGNKILNWAGLDAEGANKMAQNDPKQLMDKQLEFLLINLNLTGSKEERKNYGGEWIPTTKYSSPYKMTVSEFTNSHNDVGELAMVFHGSFERSGDAPGSKALTKRVEYANKWYDFFRK